MRKTWLEVALNGPWGKARQPGIPIRVADIVAEGIERGLLEWAVVDPGSVNLGSMVYLNPEDHVRHGLALASRFGFHPGYAIYEPGFLRLGAAPGEVRAALS